MTISLPRSLLLGLTLLLAACGGEGLTLPPDGAAANIVITWGNGQSGRVGSTLAESLVVQVTDTRNRPVAGANVVFEFIADGSAASPATASTDANGVAWSRLVLGTRVGPVSGTVRVPVDAGVTPVQAAITATATSADANGIALVSGDGQIGSIGTQLPAPLVVAVTDAFGNPIPNVAIEWSVTGGGSVSAATTLTGADGQASVTRTLGPTAGPQSALATASGLAGSPVPFNHTATAGSAARVVVVDGNGQSAPAGTRLAKDLVVQVLDDQNNPISGRAVSWVVGTGGGSASPETSTTDGNGQAKTQWTLGPTPGPNTLTAVVSGVGNGLFNATGTKVASVTTITSHQPEPALVGTPVNVGVTVAGSGGPPTGQVTVAGDGVPASTCNITLANGSGSCQITFAQPGNREFTATYAGDTRFSGSSASGRHQVNPAPVPNSSPTAAFTAPSCTTGQPCQFNDQSTDTDGTIVTWLWDFGDGVTSALEDPTHTYATAGSKSVTLTVTDDDGATNSVTHGVTVTDPAGSEAPVAVDDPSYTTPAGTQLSVGYDDRILKNDTDPDTANDLLVVNLPLVQGVSGGTLTVDVSGTFQYTPNAGTTIDTFKYQARDPEGNLSNIATVTITMTP